MTGYPSIDKPWLKYYNKQVDDQDIPSPDCSMDVFMRQCNRGRLDYTALNYFGTKISYGDMFANVDKVAGALQKLGVKKGDFVSLCALNTPEFVYLLYAVNKIGAICNWMGLTSPVSDLRKQLVSTKSKFVFTVELAYEQIREAAANTFVEQIITIPIEYSMPAILHILLTLKNKHPKENVIRWKDFLKMGSADIKPMLADVNGDDLAIIEYTGGSTGIPKGVMLSNKNMNSYYVNFSQSNNAGILNYFPGEKYLSGVPFFLAFGASCCCHGPLSHSMELILAPDPMPKAGVKMIIRMKTNHIIGGRLLVDALIQKASGTKVDLSFIRSIMYGGEAANTDWEKESEKKLRNNKMSARIRNGYGMTETAAAILIPPTGDICGVIPYCNVDVKIVDPDNYYEELGYDAIGELCLSADTVMLGYYQNESATKETLFQEGDKRWIRTKDLASIDKDGVVHITGRIKRIYHKLGADNIEVRVYPMRIEEAIMEVPGVNECAVVGIKDDITAYRTIAYLIPSESNYNQKALLQEAAAICREKLPESHIPDEYKVLSEFPITRAGKVDYRELEKIAKEETKKTI